jgi:hypothetical protein
MNDIPTYKRNVVSMEIELSKSSSFELKCRVQELKEELTKMSVFNSKCDERRKVLFHLIDKHILLEG